MYKYIVENEYIFPLIFQNTAATSPQLQLFSALSENLVSAPLLVQYFCTHRNCIQQTSGTFIMFESILIDICVTSLASFM